MSRFKIFSTISLLSSLVIYGASDHEAVFVKKLKNGQEQKIAIFGTSLTKVGAWGGQLQSLLDQQFPNKAKVINAAQGGSNSTWGKKSLDTNVLKHNPDTVFIEFAINDAVAKRRVSVEKAQENLNDIIDRILAQNKNCEIILSTMNVPVGQTGIMRPEIDKYYQMYRDVAVEREFKLIDHNKAWKKLLQEKPQIYIQYVPDAIHPVYEGALHIIIPNLIQDLGLGAGKAQLSKEVPCWNYMFNSMDKIKKDRKITRAEYELFWVNHFKMQDANKDGVIQADEYPEQGIFNHFDANKDKKVDLEEYQKVYVYHFNKFSKRGFIDLKLANYHF
jgi:acyl-CoA thioesterase I